MRGTIVQKGQRFYVATHHRGPDGKRRQAWHGGYATRADAERALQQVLARIEGGEFVTPSRLTVGQYLVDQWLSVKRSTVRGSTWASYESMLRLHVVPVLGGAQLQRLTATDLNFLYSSLLDHGSRKSLDERGLSRSTVRYIHTILRRALADAVRWGLVVRNVADAADPPRGRMRTTEMRTWSPEQLSAFLAGTAGDRLHPVFVVAATTGMRRGEILGLRWKDVSLDEAQVSVRQQLTSLKGVMRFTEPKTNRSRRTINLDGETVRVLRKQRTAQAAERLASDVEYQDLDLVFAQEDGTPIRPARVSARFSALGEELGLPHIRFHDLRHTNATLSLQAGLPAKVISERLGHSTVAFTMDVYAHAIPALHEQAAQRVGELIFGHAKEA